MLLFCTDCLFIVGIITSCLYSFLYILYNFNIFKTLLFENLTQPLCTGFPFILSNNQVKIKTKCYAQYLHSMFICVSEFTIKLAFVYQVNITHACIYVCVEEKFLCISMHLYNLKQRVTQLSLYMCIRCKADITVECYKTTLVKLLYLMLVVITQTVAREATICCCYYYRLSHKLFCMCWIVKDTTILTLGMRVN